MQAQWFESWFDSPWYPILYSHRDYAEAEEFISNLLEALAPPATSKFLDLACGRGRHARFIHAKGFDVTGVDLSAASIADAQLFSAPDLRFRVHDMRKPFGERYDYIFNLFTSFGYFADRNENLLVLQNVVDALTDGGSFVLDFFNLQKVLGGMVAEQRIEKDGVRFWIQKKFENGLIIKTIELEDKGSIHHFEERVQGLDLAAFEELFSMAGLEIVRIWGDYRGGEYDPVESPRLILIGRKISKKENYAE